MVKIPCEKCKKKIESSATICPFCHTHFTPEEMKTRQDGIKFGCIVIVVIALAIWLFTSCDSDEKKEPAAPEASAEKSVNVETVKLTDKQNTAVSYSRSVMLHTISCESTVDNMQRDIDKMGRGEKSLVDGYSALRHSIGSCQDDLKFLRETDFDNIKDQEAVSVGKQALASCVTATEKRVDALKKLSAYLKGPGDLDLAADYKAGVQSAMNDHASCKLTLAGLPAFYNVPKSEVNFLEF